MAGNEELRGKYVDELTEGMTAIFTKTVTEADIVLYAGISGDTNPVHLDEEFAKPTMFKGRIAHGMLTGASSPRSAVTSCRGRAASLSARP